MNKCASEVYASIVAAPIGEKVYTNHQNGKNYGMEEYLREQGYKLNVDFTTGYDYNRHETFITKITEICQYEEPKHNVKIGDVFYYSWGYEQTNIDFYQVVAITDKTVSIRKIESVEEDYNSDQMTGHKTALNNRFCGDVSRKTPFFSHGLWYLNMDYGVCSPWDGEPKNFSCYA